LKECTPEILATALRGERPATVALTLTFLDIPQASAVLKLLPPELRHEAVTRQLQPTPLNQELVNRILRVVLARCRHLAATPTKPSGDELIYRMAELIRSLGKDDRREIVERLERSDPESATKVRKQLYRFTDVLRLDDRTLQTILGELNVKTLAVCLKDATEEIKTKIMNNVSRRARENVAEEMELLGGIQPAQIEEARGQVVDAIRRLDQEGGLSL
jgi:flagellar motor switch protein FliG